MAPSWPDRLARVVAALAAAAAALACGGPGTARPPSPPPPSLPAGYTAYDGGKLGFRFGLAPGWQRVGEVAADGVSFADPSGQGTLLVHVEQARSAPTTLTYQADRLTAYFLPVVMAVCTATFGYWLEAAGWRMLSFAPRVPGGLPNQETILCAPT